MAEVGGFGTRGMIVEQLGTPARINIDARRAGTTKTPPTRK